MLNLCAQNHGILIHCTEWHIFLLTAFSPFQIELYRPEPSKQRTGLFVAPFVPDVDLPEDIIDQSHTTEKVISVTSQ